MINLKHFVYLTSIMIILISCKNDNKEVDQEKGNQVKNEIENKKIVNNKTEEKKVIEPIDNGENLIFPRLVFNEDTKMFAGSLSTIGLSKLFSKSETKHIVFAPSNKAFNDMPIDEKSTFFTDKELLEKRMKGHIIEGNLDYSELSNKISANGVYSFKSISGSKLKASFSGEEIVIKDRDGNEAKVIGGKSITTENGIIYIIDKVLYIN